MPIKRTQQVLCEIDTEINHDIGSAELLNLKNRKETSGIYAEKANRLHWGNYDTDFRLNNHITDKIACFLIAGSYTYTI